MAYDPLGQLGTCTVIVAREGPVDRDADHRLLRAAEQQLGYPSGSLVRPAGMGRVEFRLVEGVSRSAADRLAAAAVGLGFAPRVRDQVGIKWSSERGVLQLLGLTAALVGGFVGFAAVTGTLAPTLGVPVFLLALTGVIWGWLRGLYLPLVVPRAALPSALAQDTAVDAAVDAAAREARSALDRLQAALTRGEVPEAARADFQASHGQLRERVAALERQTAELAAEPEEAVRSLRDRLEHLDPHAAAARGERERLEAALADQARVAEAREGRRVAGIAELLEIRRAVDEALADLHDVDPTNPTAHLRRQVSALRAASDEQRASAEHRARAAARAHRT